MDLINATSTVSIITGATGDILNDFLPIFALAIGLALAFAVITGLLNVTLSRQNEGQKFSVKETYEDFFD